jgi:hypothetical protein
MLKPAFLAGLFYLFLPATLHAQSVNPVPNQTIIVENWSAVGLLTTEVKGKEAKADFISIDDFGSKNECVEFVEEQSKSSDFIGKGGTDQNVPEVQWNFDAICIKKRSFVFSPPSLNIGGTVIR